MTTPDFILALFYAVDQEMLDVPKHPEAKLSPSEVVTLALLHTIKGGGTRAYLPLFSPRAGAHPFGPAFQDAHGVDRTVSGCSHRAGRGGHLWDRVDPPHAGRAQLGPNWAKGPEPSSVDCWWQALLHLEPVGRDVCLGLRHRQRLRRAFSPSDCPV